MPDALVLATDDRSIFDLQRFFKNLDFRLKFTYNEDLLKEWLETKSFDLLLLPLSASLEAQEKFASALWRSNVQAFLVLYDPTGKDGSNKKKVRLMGANLIIGENYLEQLARITAKIAGCKHTKKQDFKILVVEDLDAARDIICSFIELIGFSQVKGVSSAKEAIKLLEFNQEEYDCIITDESMPEMNGHELIERFRSSAELKNLPIIVLTAHGTQDCLLQSLKVGASGFLVKPPSKSDLLRELARAVRVKLGVEKARLVEEDQAEDLAELLSSR